MCEIATTMTMFADFSVFQALQIKLVESIVEDA